MNKLIPIMLGLLLMISLVSAKTASIPVTSARQAQSSTANAVASSGGDGGALLTKYANINGECVKRDIINRPVLIKAKAEYKLQPQYYILAKQAPEGYAWLVRVIPGKYGIVLNDNGIGLKKNCDDSSSDNSPLLINWFAKA